MRHIRLKLFAVLCLVVGFHVGKSVGRNDTRAAQEPPEHNRPSAYVKG